jgi:hypothetical protein
MQFRRIVAAEPVVAVRCTGREQSACLSWAKAVHDIKISGHVTVLESVIELIQGSQQIPDLQTFLILVRR